jgi:viroplasmin and RNaseH domain-containing protein
VDYLVKGDGMRTVVIGSQKWCDEWAQWHWGRAMKWADRFAQPHCDEEFCALMAMNAMFEHYAWKDAKPWA